MIPSLDERQWHCYAPTDLIKVVTQQHDLLVAVGKRLGDGRSAQVATGEGQSAVPAGDESGPCGTEGREQISQHGPEIGIDEIAAVAGVAVGTLYRRLPNKADLVVAAVAEHIEGLTAEAEAATARVALGAGALDEITGLIDHLVDACAADHAVNAAVHSPEPTSKTRPRCNSRPHCTGHPYPDPRIARPGARTRFSAPTPPSAHSRFSCARHFVDRRERNGTQTAQVSVQATELIGGCPRGVANGGVG